MSDSLSAKLEAYAQHRADTEPLPKGSAPYVSSQPFKLHRHPTTMAEDRWNGHLSFESKSRTRSTLKSSSIVHNKVQPISLGVARPDPSYYPWHSLIMQTSDTVPARSVEDSICSKGESAYDLGVALNYGFAAGSPQLLRWVTEHVELLHCPPYEEWACNLTCGTTSAIDIILRMLCDRGSHVLVEEYSYPGAIEAARALGVTPVAVKMDDEGLLSTDLQAVLQDWDTSRSERPKVLYTIPTGQNPTGSTQSLARRKAIYEVAEQFDLLVIEDDPYYLLQLDGVAATIEEYVSRLSPSYVSLDVSGRVLRLDATSKTLAPGLRCGWVTGCATLIEKFMVQTEMSVVAPSGPSQVLLYKLLDQTWGHAGFFNWLRTLSLQYKARLDTLLTACEEDLPQDVCRWTVPVAGMFLWISVDWMKHPIARLLDTTDNIVLHVEDRIYQAATGLGVTISKGSWFSVNSSHMTDVRFRLTFAAADDNALRTAIRRLAGAIAREFETYTPNYT